MPFVSLKHPTDENAHLIFNTDELVVITTDLHRTSSKPSIRFSFKGDKMPIELGYDTKDHRDQAYQTILELMKPYESRK